MPDDRPGFADVCAAEREEIDARRRQLNLPPLPAPPGSTRAGLVGLALSGGGIRSATFGLGVLQALAEHRLLRYVDYLSTVSGGGFIGGCVSSLLNDPTASPDDFPLRSRVGETDTPAVRHLRNSQNYLAPGGFIERMRIPALMLRGVLLNLLFLCPYLLLAVSATEALVYWNAGAAQLPVFRLLPALAPAIFLLLVITYPVACRRIVRARWDVRNRYEAAVTFWFVATLVSVVMWPFFAVVDDAIHLAPADVLAIAGNAVSMTFSLATLAVVVGIAGACALSARVAAAVRRLALVGAAASPLLVVGMYLVLCVMLIDPPAPGTTVGWTLPSIAAGWWLFNVLFFNVNASSAHGFYRDRLSRAYLIRRDTASDEVSPLDRQLLSNLNGPGTAAPYHLINVTQDLNGTTDVNVRGRNSDFFTFSKRYTGGTQTGYCRTRDVEAVDPHLDLGTAMAISGAAASPNAGVVTVKQLVTLMTLLNVRLGYWLPNPALAGRSMRQRFGPGPAYLWREALGRVDSHGPFVNLSDGGHIENLAIYQLLRRRCAVVIAVDGEQDPGMYFDGLLKLLLYARIDLGIEIAVDLSGLRLDANRLSATHTVIGSIDYGDGETGTLIYLKASMTGDEDEIMRDYRRTHPEFPHEPTSEQFFTERQFEMYRALGFHIGSEAAAAAVVFA